MDLRRFPFDRQTLDGLPAGQQIQFRVFSVSKVGTRSILGLSSNVAAMG